MEPYKNHQSIAALMNRNNVDTDQIVPKQFLKKVERTGFGAHLFHDWRFNPDGSENPAFELNKPAFKGARILVTGDNFGCGSSREHAPQAIYRYGFRAVIAESFAEIFFGNCTTLGIPCVTATTADIALLASRIEANPALEVTVDVEKNRVFFGDENFTVHIPESAREVLIAGHWDPIADLLDAEPAVASTAAKLDYMSR